MSGQRPVRCCLSVPGGDERMIDKARRIDVDMVVIDLEDAVAPSEKERARSVVTGALNEPWACRVVGVRVNGPDSSAMYRDVGYVVEHGGDRLDVLVVPKVESAAHVVAVELLAAHAEARAGRRRPVSLHALIETPAGFVAIDRVAASSARLDALVLGALDLAASTGLPLPGTSDAREYPGDPHAYVDGLLVTAAHATGLSALHGPFLDVRDADGLAAEARRARRGGYDGKWVIHPAQVRAVEEAFLAEWRAIGPVAATTTELPT